MKTKQETFDTVVRAILTQGKPSYDSQGGGCKYRGPDGTKCAAGHLIPDAKYNAAMEGVTCCFASAHANKEYDRCVTVMTVLKEEGYDPEFVRKLQRAHDDAVWSKFLPTFRRSAEALAAKYELNLNVLTEFPL